MEKKILVAIVLLIAGLLGVGHLISSPQTETFKTDLQNEFQEFQWKYGKVYNDINEESKRYEIFSETYKKIEEHNKKDKDVVLAINQFADLTDEEYQNTYLTKFYEKKETPKKQQKATPSTNRPQTVDWVGTLVWEGVNDQGQCGSCWAFSSTQALEGAYAKEYGKFQLLAVQEVLDCAENEFGNLGCNGGLYDHVFEWVKEYGGICKREDYREGKYYAKVEGCLEDQCTAALKNINGWVDVEKYNEEAFLNALAIVPLSVAIDANQFVFRYYHGGIINTKSFRSLDHAVLAVGYNEKDGYIKVKNSWAAGWGEKGYFRLALNNGKDRGTLGVYSVPAYPTYPGEPSF